MVGADPDVRRWLGKAGEDEQAYPLCHLPNVDALDPDLRRRCKPDRHRRADIETGGLQPGDTFDDGVGWRDQQGRVALNKWRDANAASA